MKITEIVRKTAMQSYNEFTNKDMTNIKREVGGMVRDIVYRIFYENDEDFNKSLKKPLLTFNTRALMMLADAQRTTGSRAWLKNCARLWEKNYRRSLGNKFQQPDDFEYRLKQLLDPGKWWIEGSFYDPRITEFLRWNIGRAIAKECDGWGRADTVGKAELAGWREALRRGYSYLMSYEIAQASMFHGMTVADKQQEKETVAAA